MMGNDQPTEAQIRDGEGRIVTRFVRTYDANGRVLEEKQILESATTNTVYAILFSATILAACKLAEIGDKPRPAREMCMEDAIRNP